MKRSEEIMSSEMLVKDILGTQLHREVIAKIVHDYAESLREIAPGLVVLEDAAIDIIDQHLQLLWEEPKVELEFPF